jgi:hypothetical protein
MTQAPFPARRKNTSLASLALSLAASFALGATAGCDVPLGDIGLHPLPPASEATAAPMPGPAAQPDPHELNVLQALFDEFAQPMFKLNDAPIPSVAVPGSSLDLYVSEDGMNPYMQARMDTTGSRTSLPEGTVILRVVRDGAGKVAKYTALAQRERGFNPPSDLWFAVYDTEGKLTRDATGAPVEGAIASCTSCHLSRADDGYVFGMPQ